MRITFRPNKISGLRTARFEVKKLIGIGSNTGPITVIPITGPRVFLRHFELPDSEQQLEQELRQILESKDEAVRRKDVEKSFQLRNRELEINTHFLLIDRNKKNKKAPMVLAENIAKTMLKETSEKLLFEGIKLFVTDRFKKHLINEDGARPLRRALMKLLVDPLANDMLKEMKEGNIAVADIDVNNNVFILVMDREDSQY